MATTSKQVHAWYHTKPKNQRLSGWSAATIFESLSRRVTCRKTDLLANRENHVTHYEFTSYFLSLRVG